MKCHDLLRVAVEEAKRVHGCNASDVATRAGMGPSQLSRALGGCRFETLQRVCRVAGLKVVLMPDDAACLGEAP